LRVRPSYNINVIAVAPALTVTDRLQFFVDGMSEQQRAEYVQGIALRRLGTAQDQANVICFLASEAAGFMTGETLEVNGGQY
jgi:3-oxoacyl-[acyl-carrier protein] reductase